MSYILVIDDDEQMNALLCEFLQTAGYQVLSAPNGQVAVRLAMLLAGSPTGYPELPQLDPTLE